MARPAYDSHQMVKALLGAPPTPPHMKKERQLHAQPSPPPPGLLVDPNQAAHAVPIRLPPLEEQQAVFKLFGNPQHMLPPPNTKHDAAIAFDHANAQPRVPLLEPLIVSWAAPGGSVEDRLAQMEHRLQAAERASSKASMAHNLQSEIVAALSSELRQASSELGRLHVHNPHLAPGNKGPAPLQHQHHAMLQQQQFEQQLQALRGDMQAQGTMLVHTQRQLSEATRNNSELRNQVGALGGELSRTAAHWATTDAALERLSLHMQQGAYTLAADQQRKLGAAEQQRALEAEQQRQMVGYQDQAFREKN